MTLHRRNVIKLGGALVVALCLAQSATLLLAQSGKVDVLWLGQATFKITTPGGKVIVIDPFVTGNPKTPAEYKDLAKLGKPTVAGWDPDHIARAWAELMKRLGYTRYVAQGGDWGNAISEVMALQQPPGLLAISTNMPATVPPEIAQAMGRGEPPLKFIEQVEYNGRRLAKLNLPPSQVVHTIPRGPGAPPVTAANVPPIQDAPAAANVITFTGGQVRIPN